MYLHSFPTRRSSDLDYDSDTGDATAEGHVVLDGGPNDEHVKATHGTYNIRTETGRFENVHGTAGIRIRARHAILTSPNPFAFRDRKSTRLNSSHRCIYTLSLHDALPIWITTPTREMRPRKAMLCWMAVPMMSTSKLLMEHIIFALKLAVLRTYMGPPASAFAPGTRS